MGFWHTGYFEFHEFYDPIWQSLARSVPVTYPCSLCETEFDSMDALKAHRFESHPFHRPILTIRGREVGSVPLRITDPLTSNDVEISNLTEVARINGDAVSIDRAIELLCCYRNNAVDLELMSQGIWARYSLLFDVALGADLGAVDASFLALVKSGRLDNRSIEDFIASSSGYSSAKNYCDGICEYLYGVLAKERSIESSLLYDKYREKFSRAADILKDYRQPIGKLINTIVAFHYNQFEEAYQLGGSNRIAAVSRRFQDWLNGTVTVKHYTEPVGALDLALTDAETEQIIGLCDAEMKMPGQCLQRIVALTIGGIPEFDMAKLLILAAESCYAMKDYATAQKHAKNLLNSPSFGLWAARTIERTKEDM